MMTLLKIKLPLLFFFALLSITKAYSQSSEIALPFVYRDTIEKFSISFPENWEIFPKGTNRSYLMAGAATDHTQPNQTSRAGFGLGITHYKTSYTTEEYYQGNLISIREMYPDVKTLEEHTVTIDKKTMRHIVYEATIHGIKTVTLQYYFFKNKTGYIMTAVSSPENWKSYKVTYDAIARSFKWL